MADAPAPGRHVLTRKLGPLPTWAWLALAVAGAGGYWLYKKHQAAGQQDYTAPQPTTAVPAGAYGAAAPPTVEQFYLASPGQPVAQQTTPPSQAPPGSNTPGPGDGSAQPGGGTTSPHCRPGWHFLNAGSPAAGTVIPAGSYQVAGGMCVPNVPHARHTSRPGPGPVNPGGPDQPPKKKRARSPRKRNAGV